MPELAPVTTATRLSKRNDESGSKVEVIARIYGLGGLGGLGVVTAAANARTSLASSTRHSPGFSLRSLNVPMRLRTRRVTGWPTASHMRRT